MSLLKGLFVHTPFRMQVGRFGIWLAQIGRTLQTRYANWNSEFRLKNEYSNNPNFCTFHVSDEVTTYNTLTFEGPNWQEEQMTPLVHDLFKIKGVAKVTLHRYKVSVVKGYVFTWNEVLPTIEEAILRHLTAKTAT